MIVCPQCLIFCRCAQPKKQRNWSQPCFCCSNSIAAHNSVYHPGMSKAEVRTMQTYTDIPGWWDEVEIVKVTRVDDPVAWVDLTKKRRRVVV